MARLKEIDDEPITQFGSQVDRALARHILALERAYNEMEDVLGQIIEWSNLTPRIAKPERTESERILPDTTSLMKTYWNCGSGGWHVQYHKGYALCQQATIEAVCRWLECGPEREFYMRLCEILRADADRVVREAEEMIRLTQEEL